MKYSSNYVVQKYVEQSKNPRVLALTASPGGTRKRIEEICKNLFIEKVEIRTEEDEDVIPYIQKREIEWEKVKLTKEILEIKKLLTEVYKEKLSKLQKFGLHKKVDFINKKDLLLIQIRLRKEIAKRNMAAFYGISVVAQAFKIGHAIELLETQDLNTFMKFLKKLSIEETKAAKTIMKDPRTKKVLIKTEKLIENGIIHPKLIKLKELIIKDLNKKTKVIVFANFRDTVKNIVKELNDIKDINAIELMGQKEGITQKKQLATIKDFEEGKYNVLVGTSISEEGLDISGASIAIFYDNVPSEIRKVQRMGRVARLTSGKIIFIMAEKTRDEAYYWSSIRKEKIMKNTLKSFGKNPIQKELEDFN